jgi:hypothetical protein
MNIPRKQPETKKESIMEVPDTYIVVYEKAIRGKSRSAGIKAFCLQCCGWEYNEVAACSDNECPLHPYRPYGGDRRLVNKAKTPIKIGGVLKRE